MSNTKTSLLSSKHKAILILLAGLIFGFVIFAGVRLYNTRKQKSVHYHANFQVWINGSQEKFESPLYYQEITACSKNNHSSPLHRAHMHDQKYDIVHVHDSAVTWNHFLENINVAVQPGYLHIGNKIYTDNSESKLSLILNGKTISSLNSMDIKSEDTLLISYGGEDSQALQDRYGAIANKASSYNQAKDPASCSGSEEASLIKRLESILN